VTGPTGPAGAVGAAVLRTSATSGTLGSDDILTAVVACDAGEVLLGGGFTIEAEVERQIDLAQVIPIQSGPTTLPNTWEARLIATANTGVVTLNVFATCAAP
jgi:hypothetical protein